MLIFPTLKGRRNFPLNQFFFSYFVLNYEIKYKIHYNKIIQYYVSLDFSHETEEKYRILTTEQIGKFYILSDTYCCIVLFVETKTERQ